MTDEVVVQETAPEPARATLIDEAAAPIGDTTVTAQTLEDVLPGETEPAVVEAAPDEDTLPEKYKGKTLREVVEMHQNAEAQLGRTGTEVGELRGVVDNFIKSQMDSAQDDEDEESPDFHLDPEAAVKHAVDNHPDVMAAKENNKDYKNQTNLAALQLKHPDMKDVLADPDFAVYVNASPVRIRLFQHADKNADFESADELITSFKERKAVVVDAATAEAGARQDAVRAASTGSAQAASSSVPAKKIYRRADLINLMKTDPARYQALQPEIMLAYKEKRVR